VRIPKIPAADSILGRTTLLLLGIAVLLTAINLSIVLSRPPPGEAPLNTFEIARLLRSQPIAKMNAHVSIQRVNDARRIEAREQIDRLTRIALARDLNTTVENVRFARTARDPIALSFLKPELQRSFELYGPDKFEAHVIGGFAAAVRLPDGTWEVASRERRDPLADWRNSIIVRFIVSLALMLPIGWFFARWLAEPIQAFGAAAEGLGRQRRVDHVEVRGPAEIKQAAKALNDMQDRIRRYLLERTSVVGAIAHDLRTPLSRLKFRLRAAPEALRAEAEAEIDEMEQLIAASLEFAQSEVQSPVRECLDLGSLVQGIADDLSDLGRPVTVENAHLVVIRGDPILLKRMMTNLINNAVTYGGRAIVKVRERDANALIDVDDEGPGLDPENLLRAFEPFYRAERSRNRTTGGVGLGLAIVKAVATAHGGQVELRNRSGGGLRARVCLPIDQD
jgi:two-component system OmpR family sensor kinase